MTLLRKKRTKMRKQRKDHDDKGKNENDDDDDDDNANLASSPIDNSFTQIYNYASQCTTPPPSNSQ